MPLLVANIAWSPEAGPGPAIAERLGLTTDVIVEAVLLKRSVDGRSRPPRWQANYRVSLRDPALEASVLDRAPHGVRAYTERDVARYRAQDPVQVPRQAWAQGIRPIVIGAGPAGLFAALRLGEAGAPAVLLERGGAVENDIIPCGGSGVMGTGCRHERGLRGGAGHSRMGRSTPSSRR